MRKSDHLYLGHMLENAVKARSKAGSFTKADFDANEDLQMVLAHLIQTIGEAASKVFESTKAAHPEIPWKEIVGIRHRIIHDYMNINYDVLWAIATSDLEPLITQLRSIIPPEEQ